MKLHKTPRLILVGAGPGSPDLITLRGLRAIRTADVILYDALVNTALLDEAPDALHVFVGKRSGRHHRSQSEINALTIEMAHQHGTVVRLKGGDPFIFARGAEELTAAAAAGLETEVIPGLSSATSLPLGQGIPLTQRFVSESFWVITGTNSKRELPEDIGLAAQSKATVVILMGIGKLSEILKVFKTYGRGSEPIAVIQKGSTPEESIDIGTINDFHLVLQQRKLEKPGIIVIGEVVRHRQTLSNICAPYNQNIA
ncbi:MAG: uroporphyrinogen-III C-methyltransferase [Bacteroidota bacterium]